MNKKLIGNIFSVTKSLSSHGKYILANMVIERTLYFVTYLVLARLIPIKEYGIFITIFTFTNILNSLLDFGFPFYIQREAVSGVKLHEKLHLILLIKLLTLILYVFVPLVYFNTYENINPVLITIVSTIVFLSGFNNILNAVYYGQNLYSITFHLMIISRIVLVTLFIVFVAFEFPIILILTSFIIALFFHTLLLIKHLKIRSLFSWKVNIDFKLIILIARSSLPIGMGLVFVIIYDRIDILLLEKIVTFEAVAFYSVGYSLYRMFQIVSSSILIPSYNIFSKSFIQLQKLRIADIKIHFFILLGVGIISTLVLLYGAEFIIKFFYGHKYSASIIILRLLSLALPGLFLNNLTGVISNSIKREFIPLIGTGLGVVLNISVGVILIFRFGIIGAVITTIATEYFVFIIQFILLYMNNKKRQIFN